MRYITLLFLSSFFLTSCAEITAEKSSSLQPPILTKTDFQSLSGWNEDNIGEWVSAFQKSCARIIKNNPQKEFGLNTKYGDWQSICRTGNTLTNTDNQSIRQFVENNFDPYRVTIEDREDGLFTGYYEASLNGSLTKKEKYNVPLLARPTDLVSVNLGEFSDELKGKKIAGRVVGNNLKPYEDRAAIEQGNLPASQTNPICWVDSAADAFFLHIQGSGAISLPDGKMLRVGYDGQNGHDYTAIGKVLIERGELTKENVSMQSIRAWLKNNPDKAQELMWQNKSYIFFRKLDANAPIGAEGVELTSNRSLAVDSAIWPYGLPIYIDAEHPSNNEKPIQRLMMAQDTGGAIKGAIRGDVFWGYGENAAHNAGLMQSRGNMWVLLPKAKLQ